MKPSGLDISGEHTKKQLNLVLVLKSKALYGSCSVNNSLKSSLGVRREEIGTEEGVGESRDWNLNGSSRKAPLRYQKSCGCEGGQVPTNQESAFRMDVLKQ